MYVYSIYDSKADAYARPFYAPKDAVAIRMVAEAARDPQTDLFKFGGDYTLFLIAEFDETSGNLYASEAKINLGTALSISASATLNNLRVPNKEEEQLDDN